MSGRSAEGATRSPPTEMTTTSRSAPDVLAASRALLDPVLRAAVATMPGSMRRIAGYHLGWLDAHGADAAGDTGKAIRPTLVFLAAEAIGGVAATAMPAAMAVELVHNFSLLHDDVMDDDHTRRHRPTAWRVFGRPAAILAGDALLSLAFDGLAASGHSAARDGARMLNAAVLGMVDGQTLDISFEQRADVELSECLRMARLKTGTLVGCACAIGASFGGGGEAQIAHLRSFGDHLGLAFQFVDDLLGIWGDPGVTGKPVHSDLLHPKKSLPVVAALTSDTPAGRALAALYRGDQPLSGTDLSQAAELIDLAGGRAWSLDQVDHLLALALGDLKSAGPTAQAAAELKSLAHLVIRRDH